MALPPQLQEGSAPPRAACSGGRPGPQLRTPRPAAHLYVEEGNRGTQVYALLRRALRLAGSPETPLSFGLSPQNESGAEGNQRHRQENFTQEPCVDPAERIEQNQHAD